MRALVVAFSLILFLCAHAQLLLPNGDFEDYTACPDSSGQIDRATGWSRPTAGTSDYFNVCFPGAPPGFNAFNAGVPDNFFGNQPAHSGNGYAGFFCLDTVVTLPDAHYREYVSRPLAAPLTPGEVYNVEFFVSLADRSAFAVNDIGALLSVHMPHRDDDLPIMATPQVSPSSMGMLADSIGWTRIRGCFTADSAYAFITIGSFAAVGSGMQEQQGPTAFPPAMWFSYYYVDDVSIQHWPRPALGPDITICEATPLLVQDTLPGVDYLWSTGATGPSITVDAAGTYSVRINDDGCPLSDTIVVHAGTPVTFDLPPYTVVDFCRTQLLVLDARPQPPYADLAWSTGDTTSSIALDAAGSYIVHGSASGYCDASASVTVTDTCSTPVYAPDAFTPNGDGINDLWRPIWVAQADAILTWSIFDRWGHALFTASGRNDAWDGTSSGKPVQNGIYEWRGHAHDPDAGVDRDLAGYLTLIR